jgi:hypothetical protein
MKTRRTLYSTYNGSLPLVAFKSGRKTGGKDGKIIPGDYIGGDCGGFREMAEIQ